MTEHRTVERYYPKILINPGPIPVVFLDTFMWGRLLLQLDDLRSSLAACCKEHRIVVAITSVVEGELSQRNFLSGVRQICGDSLVSVPVGRIAANQIVHALVCYEQECSQIVLSWELALSEVPALDHPEEGLKSIIENLAEELNDAKQAIDTTKEKLVSTLVNVEREVWKGALRSYGDVFDEIDADRELKTGEERETYATFFLTDFFTDLPTIVLRSYLFAYLLNERPMKLQDVVDIYTVSELLPYSKLFIMDRDQHNRIMCLQQDYPTVFGRLDEICPISSFLRNSRLDPVTALQTFLEGVSEVEGESYQASE